MTIRLVKSAWKTYRDKLSLIIEASAKRNNHSFSSDVISQLDSDFASLFMANDGFLVLRPTFVKNETGVLILFAWNSDGSAALRYQPSIEVLARELNASYIALNTAVEKLGDMAEKQGYRLVKRRDNVSTYRKEVS